MSKVDELVEWVAETMCNRDEKLGECYGRWNEVEELTRKDYRVTARQILSYPYLYLQITGEPILTMDLGAGDESYCAVDYIPLAEALKEVKE